MLNKKIKAQTETTEGKAMFCVVREFLEFFNLDFTVSVFEPESYLGTSYKYEGRSRTIEGLGISELDENSKYPILLQLIHLAKHQTVKSNNSVRIHLNNNVHNDMNGMENDKSMFKNNNDSQNYSLISENLETSQKELSKQNALNATYNLTTPTVEMSPRSNINGFETNSKMSENDEDTCSVSSEKSHQKEPFLIDLNKSVHLTDLKSPVQTEKQRYIIDQSLTELEFSPPILKESKAHLKSDSGIEKLKLSPQITEKLKPKNTLTTLTDLPPLQAAKTRSNDSTILPNLHNKEQTSLKEIDKLLEVDSDSLDNYEEDFMSGSDLDLSANKTDVFKSIGAKVDLLEEFRKLGIEDKANKEHENHKGAIEESSVHLDSNGSVKSALEVSEGNDSVASSIVSDVNPGGK